MFDAVFEKVIKEVIPEFSKKLQPSSNLEEVIRSFVEFYNNFFKENPQFPQFFFLRSAADGFPMESIYPGLLFLQAQ